MKQGVAEITSTMLLLGVVTLLSLLAFSWGFATILNVRDAARVYDAEQFILNLERCALSVVNRGEGAASVAEIRVDEALVRFVPDFHDNISIYLAFEELDGLSIYNLSTGVAEPIDLALITDTVDGHKCLLLMEYEAPFVEVLVPSKVDLLPVGGVQLLRGTYGDVKWDKYLVSEGECLLPGGFGFFAVESLDKCSSLVVFSRPSESLYAFAFFIRARLLASCGVNGGPVVNVTLLGCRARPMDIRLVAVSSQMQRVVLANRGVNRLVYRLAASEPFHAYIYAVINDEAYMVSEAYACSVEVEAVVAEIGFSA